VAELPSLSWGELVLRLALAAALGGAIGFEREFRERQAGLRTHLLVALGAALFTVVSAYAWREFEFARASGVSFDPSRVAAGIVTGIGFLGAGAIIRHGVAIRGLTTAASLWLAAAVGLAAGAGAYGAAALATGLALLALGPLRIAERRLFDHHDDFRLVLELAPGEPVGPALETIRGAGGRIGSVELDEAHGRRRLEVEADFAHGTSAAALEQVSEREHVLRARRR
jgi:putative Mg2+ transporter-C (MgtC) family protein